VFSAYTKDGKRLAVKKMALNSESAKLIATEIKIMKTSQHPNIVTYYNSFIVDEQLWVVMEFMGAGCLTDVLDQFDTVRLNEAQIAFVAKEVLKALIYIHNMHRIHRDIKSDNILISEAGEVKIGKGFAFTLLHRAGSLTRTPFLS
jgi:serine/threonine protein kinase